MRRRARRVLLLLARLVFALAALVTVVVLATMAALRTEWGREQLRRRLEARLDAMVYGDVELGEVELTVGGRLAARGLVVRDEAGRVLVRAESVLIDFAPAALLSRTFRARRITLVAPEVRGRRDADGRLDLARLLRPAPPVERPWRIDVARLEIVDGRASLEERDGGFASLVDLDVVARLNAKGDRLELDLGNASAYWVEREVDAAVAGRLRLGGGALAAHGVELRLGEARASLPLLLARPGTGRAAALVALAVPAAEVRRFAPDSGWLADAALAGAARRAGPGAPWQVHLEGRVGGAPAELAIEVDPRGRAIRGRVEAADLAPRSLHAGAPAGRVTGVVEADLAGRSLATLRGTARIDAEGTLYDVDFRRLRAAGRAGGGVMRVSGALDAPEGRLTAQAFLRERAGGVVVDAARVRGRVPDELAELVGGVRAARVDVDATAAGPTDALRVRGAVWLRGARSGPLRAAAARLDVELDAVPAATHGTVRLRADSAMLGGEPLGELRARARFSRGARRIGVAVTTSGRGATWELDGTAVVVRARRETRVELGEVRLVTRGLPWKARGGELVLRPRGAVAVRDLALVSPAGRVELDGDVDRVGVRHGRGRLHVHALGLDLGRVVPALAPRAPPLRGVVTLDLHLKRQRRDLAADATGHVVGLAWREGVPPLDGRLALALEGGRLQVRASARGPGVGAVTVEVDAAAPRDALDSAAWRRFDERSIHAARVELERVTLERVAAVAGRPTALGGRLDGVLRVGQGARRAEVDLVLRDLRGRSFRDLDVDVRAVLSGDTLVAGLDAKAAGTHLGGGSLVLRAGLPELAARGMTALLEAEASGAFRIRRVPLEAVARALRPRPAMAGRLDAAVELSGTLARPIVEVTGAVAKARLGGVPFAELALEGRLDPEVVVANVRARQRGGGALQLSARADRDPAGAIAAQLSAQRLELAALRAFAARAGGAAFADAEGRLDADLALTGPRASPQLRGRARVQGGAVRLEGGTRRLEDVNLTASMDGGVLVARATGRSGEGSVRASLRADLDGLTPRAFAGTLVTRRLSVNAGRMVVAVDLDAKVSGDRPAGGPWRLLAEVRDGTLRLPKERSGELQQVGPLEDVVYVDARGVARRRRAQEHAAAGPATPVLTMRVTARRGVVVRGNDVDTRVRAELDVTYGGGRTSVRGDLEALGGDVELYGRRYLIERARATLGGEVPSDPRLDIRLSHEFETAIIYVDVRGTLREPELALSSDPPTYDEAQLLGFVLGGDPDDPALARRPLGDRALGLASGLLAGQVQGLLERALPVDVLRVEVGEGVRSSATRVTVGKWLTEQLFVSYHYRFEAEENENANEGALRYRFLRNWLLEARFGDRGNGEADVLWIRRY